MYSSSLHLALLYNMYDCLRSRRDVAIAFALARLAIHSHIRFESSIESRRDSNACDKKRGNKYAASAKGRVYHAQCNGATAVAFHCRSHRWYK